MRTLTYIFLGGLSGAVALALLQSIDTTPESVRWLPAIQAAVFVLTGLVFWILAFKGDD